MTATPADESADATITPNPMSHLDSTFVSEADIARAIDAAKLRAADTTIAFMSDLIRVVGGTVVPSRNVVGNWCWRGDDERLLAILSADEAAQLSRILGLDTL